MTTDPLGSNTSFFGIAHRIRTILFAIFFACLGNGLLGFLIPILLTENGVSKTGIGITLSMYSVGFAIGCFFSHKVINRVGHIRTYVFMATTISLAALMHSMVGDFITTALLRLLTGLAMSTIYITFESWLNGAANRNTRGSILGTYQTAVASGLAASPWLLTLFDSSDFRLYSMVAIALGVSLLPISISRIPAPKVDSSTSLYKFHRLFLDSPSAFVGALISGSVIVPLYQMMIVYLADIQLSTIILSLILACAYVGMFVFQIPVGRLADLFDKRKVSLALLLLCVAAVAVLLVNSFSWESIWLLGLCYALICGSASCLFPLSQTLLFDQIAPEHAVPATASMLVLHSIGVVVGPVLSGLLMEELGSFMLFVFVATMAVLFIVFLCVRIFIMNIHISQENLPYFMSIQTIRPSNINLNPSMDYQIALIQEPFFTALVESLTRANPKEFKSILSSAMYKNGMTPETSVLSLVLSLPRYSDDILRALVALYPEKRFALTEALHDIIALDKKRINRLLYKGLAYKSTHDDRVHLHAYFDRVIDEEQQRQQQENPA